MNIQIFGTKKCKDTKKAERFFKERSIKFQSIDMNSKGISKGELESVIRALGSMDQVIDEGCKDKVALSLVKYAPDNMKLDKLLEEQAVIRTPLVRNGKQATVGYQPDIWKNWE